MKEVKREILFRKQERISLIFIVLLVAASYVYTFFIKPKVPSQTKIYNIEEVVRHEPDLDTTIVQVKKLIAPKKYPKKKFSKTPINLQSFDPNKADSITLLHLGLKPWTVANILKYRSKGGKFYQCSDLAKIYSLEPETYETILPYCTVTIAKKKPSLNKKAPKSWTNKSSSDSIAYKKKKYEKPITIVDVNTADTTEFKTLRGIGSVYAARIVKFRNSLGGFHSIKQLREIWGLEPEVIDQNLSRLTITPMLTRIDMNAPKDSLAAHPYIDWRIAKIIENYRLRHGEYQKPEDILKTKVISDSLFNKLKPYF